MILPILLLLAQSLNVPGVPCDKAGKGAAIDARLRGWSSEASAPNVGRSFVLTTADPATVRLIAPFDLSHGGRIATATIRVPRDGVYAVAIDRKGWIDVATGTTIETSVAHRHGADGSGVAKIVDFRLTAGDHVVGVTGVAGDQVKVLVTPAPGA